MAFVVTSGQLQSVQQTYNNQNASYVGPLSRMLSLSPTLAMTYEQLYRSQPAVRMVVGFLARNVASVSADPYRRISATDREKAVDHPLARLLDRPMFGTQWTKYRLFNTLMHDLGVYDNAFWLKLKGPNGGMALIPMLPRMVSPIGTNLFAPEGYRIQGNRGYFEVPTSSMVHFHGYNPDDPRYGVSPLETLRHILAEEYSATVYREQMWRNGARISGYIKRPKDAGKWSDPAQKRFKQDWQSLYSGDGPATGGTPILEDGMEFVPSSVTPRDAQYVESRKLTREETAVAYHVNPVMLGLMDGATIGNVKELHRMLYQDTLPPWMTQISQDMEVQLLDEMDSSSVDGRVYVEFNLKEKLRGNFEEQAAAFQSAVGGPWMTRNEARGASNLPALPDADDLIVPLNVTKGGLASPNDTAPEHPDNGPSNGEPPKEWAGALRAFFERQGKSILSALGAGRTNAVDLLHIGRWDVELAADLAQVGAAGALDVNTATMVDLSAALGDAEPVKAVADLFRGYVGERAQSLARELEPA